MGAAPGWVHHSGKLKLDYDETWGCYAAIFDGTQFALSVEPLRSLSRLYLNWTGPSRLYGELQFLSYGHDEPEVLSYPVCSYRVMARAKQSSRTSVSPADWMMFNYWVRSISKEDAQSTRRFTTAIRSAIEPLGVAWSRDPASKQKARHLVEQVCRRLGGFEADLIYRWVRLFVG